MPSIQACPALRAPRTDPRVSPRAELLQKEAAGKNANGTHAQVLESKINGIPTRARACPPGAELQQLYSEGKHAEILARVDACLPKDGAGNFVAEQEKSDVVHDLLAFLAERMLEMNNQKQQEIKGFLGWLEGFVGAKVEDMTPKTKLQSYYEHDYESFLAVLKKNKKRLTIDPARREPAEALRAEFEGSVDKLQPLRERIRQTDELIDVVVYRLYGLTEEEIAIVEGR